MMLAVCLLVPDPARADDGLALSGSFTSSAGLGLTESDRGHAAFDTELRVILENAARGSLGFRAEGGYRWAYGLSSPLAIAWNAGLAIPPPEEALLPDSDLHREFFIDQAYARAILGRLEIRAGIFPVSWGSAYFYNPVARNGAPVMPGENLDNRAGKPGAAISLALPLGLSLEAYALAEGRQPDALPAIDELSWSDIPWGTRLQLRTAYLDVSASVMKTLPMEGSLAGCWVGMDTAASIGDLSFYAEFATNGNDSEASIGLWLPLPDYAAELRGEYIWLQGGGANPAAYDVASLLSGKTSLLGQSYMFLGIEKEDPRQATWRLAAGALLNLNDQSAGLLTEASWMPLQDLEISWYVRLFTGSDMDEFGGSLSPAPGLSIIPYRSMTGLTATWNF